MQASLQELHKSHSESFIRPPVKVEKRLTLYVVMPLSSVEAMQESDKLFVDIDSTADRMDDF